VQNYRNALPQPSDDFFLTDAGVETDLIFNHGIEIREFAGFHALANAGRPRFGHAGNFSTVAWADPTTGCAVAVVTNGNRAPTKLVTRFAGIGSGLRAACTS
jgi:CubicO group peptidase (beta-lactamase class C family)